ncbi:hypothetical protein FRC02_008208 [Tulasnella sp. 418]|nr:hypothetical protein FRC02_008208 [Tulasnella sp. 418]
MSSSSAILGLTLLTALVVWLVHRISKIGQREPFLPPGPDTIPVLGNITLLPKTDMYRKFCEWAKQYGEVFSLKVASQTIIVVSSPEAVAQIMEKNGLITADRPPSAHQAKIFGEDGILTTIPYGPQYRLWRKAANEMMSLSACERHAPIQLAETSQLLTSLLDHPQDFLDEVKRTILSVAFSVFFGVRCPTVSSPEPRKFIDLTEKVFVLGAPGECPPVDIVPLLHYLPDKFSNNWKKRSDDLRVAYEELWNNLSARSEKKMEAGIPTGCFIETLNARASEWNLDRITIRNMAGSFLAAAAHTTIATVQWFIKLAAIHPDAQAKLHAEMDQVVGSDRLPTPEDMPRLPHLHAFLRELHRFRTIAPVGAPHLATEDQSYKNYIIPKGSTIFVNIWGIFHDPNLFDNPDEFNPDRFIYPTPEQTQSWKRLETLPFGVGRRICPGMHFANTTVELIAASLVWGFEFRSPLEGGPSVDDFKTFLTCDPLPFKCDVIPRSAAKAEMMRHNFNSSKSTLDKFEKDV